MERPYSHWIQIMRMAIFLKKNHWLFLRYMTIFNYDHGKFCKVAMATLVEIAWN